MNPKITKGPWQYFAHGGYCFFIHSKGDPLKPRIATVDYTDGAHSFHEADARLIAQAPAMAEALEAFVKTYDDYVSNHDGLCPFDCPDAGCIECTIGTVPNDKNTGLCAYHLAKAALAKVDGK